MNFNIEIVRRWPIEKINKQIDFGTAVGLTKTAQAGQKAIQDSLKGHFTLRNSWWEKGNKYGIKIKAAKPNNLEATIHTAADWLIIHEEGGVKKALRNHLAIPTENVRRNKKNIIRGNQRPSKLVNSFLVTSKKSGTQLLIQRKGKGNKSEVKVMYVLIPRAQVKSSGTFFKAAMHEIASVKDSLISTEVSKALANIK